LGRSKGKLADLVLWSPAFFGVKPDCIIKGGTIIAPRWAIPMRRSRRAMSLPADVRAFGKALHTSSVVFMSKAALKSGLRNKLGVEKDFVAVQNTRGGISRRAWCTTAQPRHHGRSRISGHRRRLDRAPADVLPMAQRYFLF
jgi:urease subunit alpha